MLGPDLNDKAPSAVNWITYLWVWVMSALGSIVGHVDKVRRETERRKEERRKGGFRYMIIDFVADLVTGFFVGITIFFILDAYHVNSLMSAAIIGMSANMSGKMLDFLRVYVAKKLGAL